MSATEEIDQGVDQLRFFAGAARLLEGKATGEYVAGLSSSIRREPIEVAVSADDGAAYGALNSASHLVSVERMIAGLGDHTTIETGGGRIDRDGFYFPATVISGVRQDDAIVQQEVFGPVLTIQSFETEGDAQALADDVPFGLATSVWTKDHGRALRMTAELDFGCAWLNTHIPFVSEIPHGGFGASGHGKDLSAYGLEEYTRVKHVMSNGEA